MRPLRLKAIAVKEAKQILRDPISLVIALLMPFIQMIMLGYGINLDVRHLPTCVYDREGSQNSQALLKHFQASPYFEIIRRNGDYREATRALDGGACRITIVIPQDFSQRLADSSTSAVQLLTDASDDNTANIGIGYAEAVVSGFSAELNPAAARPQPVAAQSRVWFNEDLESRNFIIPGVVALVMALVGAQLTSLTVSREWERGTMELLVSTPVSPTELMLGKLAPYFLVGMLDAVFCLTFAVFWFHVPFRGQLWVLFLTTALFLTVVLGIGYLISVAIRSQLGASQVGLLVTMLPTVMLSGFAFPIDQMPKMIQVICTFVFARYYITILKAIFLKGSGLLDLLGPIAALLAYAAVVGFFAARAFKKQLE